MRWSGAVLVVLIFVHLFVNLVLGDGIQQIDFAFVAGKWAHPFWQWFDLIMLWLAMLHGSNGLRVIINDYADTARMRLILKAVLLTCSATIIALGSLVIFTFDPAPPKPPQNHCPHSAHHSVNRAPHPERSFVRHSSTSPRRRGNTLPVL